MNLLAACMLLVAPPIVNVNDDNVQVTESCILKITDSPIRDADGNGVVHITASDITVSFAEDARLRGAAASDDPDTFTGTGIVITGENVTLTGGAISGYKVGVHAINTDGLVLEGLDVSDNFAQRLKSTPQAEDSSDWLWPHANDDNQWIENYGAGICIEDSDDVIVRNIHCRRTQNGIILDRVNNAKVYDNDCSFLSGWGLALWRSSDNTISRNVFDFCIRGYSHGVYNRGQDSAGILMFEQCCDNVVIENSATHGGDGIFAFAGKEALGEVNPRDDGSWYKDRGNNNNIFARNGLSYAAAHGLELTFSADNAIIDNRLTGNAICGIWGGYSRRTLIRDNIIEDNGEMGYGSERGGINIEHGVENQILLNEFQNNKCGIFLWWDPDESIAKTPWGQANDLRSNRNYLISNTFTNDEIAIQLRDTTNTFIFHLQTNGVGTEVDADQKSTPIIAQGGNVGLPSRLIPEPIGQSTAIGRHAHLHGREHIIMTEWGPYDWRSPLVQWNRHIDDDGDVWLEARLIKFDHQSYEVISDNLRGIRSAREVERDGEQSGHGHGQTQLGPLLHEYEFDAGKLAVHRLHSETGGPVQMTVRWTDENGREHETSKTIVLHDWQVTQFESPVDPREDVEAWRDGARDVDRKTLPALQLKYGHGGPKLADGETVADHFGTIATTSIELPAGRWRIATVSDDGIRVWLNDERVIDDWTWHGPTSHDHEFELESESEIDLRVEHFELDGYAVLDVKIEPVR